jgi:hypothetical protein
MIECVMGTDPVLKVASRMALVTFKELKVKVQELLDKEFIYLSSSQWRVSVLFVKKNDVSMSVMIIRS